MFVEIKSDIGAKKFASHKDILKGQCHEKSVQVPMSMP